MRIYAFEGPHEVYATASLAAAEGHSEAIDVENDEHVFFGDDGSVVSPSVRDERVVLTPTDEKRPEELRERLGTFLVQPRVAMDPALTDDPAALADLLIDRSAPDDGRGGLPGCACAGWADPVPPSGRRPAECSRRRHEKGRKAHASTRRRT